MRSLIGNDSFKPHASLSETPIGLELSAAPSALLFASDLTSVLPQIDALTLLNISVSKCHDLDQFQTLLDDTSDNRSLVIVELDGFGGISTVIDRLLSLRLHRPDLVILLLSSKSRTHDFTTERLALCDVSLMMPCAAADIAAALACAVKNNAEWQRRVEDTESLHYEMAAHLRPAISLPQFPA